jgi:hypothetical protein
VKARVKTSRAKAPKEKTPQGEDPGGHESPSPETLGGLRPGKNDSFGSNKPQIAHNQSTPVRKGLKMDRLPS